MSILLMHNYYYVGVGMDIGGLWIIGVMDPMHSPTSSIDMYGDVSILQEISRDWHLA